MPFPPVEATRDVSPKDAGNRAEPDANPDTPNVTEGEVALTPATIDRIARAFPAGGGVYLLTDADDRFVQLASAGSLRRALRVRLLEPEVADAEEANVAGTARKRARLAEIVRTIRWEPASSPFEIMWRYLEIAREMLPDAYREHVAFSPAWFVGVNVNTEFPRFEIRKILRDGDDHLGPFATRNDATRFIQILEDAFDLCRYYDILQQAPHGEACAYYEMGKCPAPCDGTVSMESYRAQIRAAWDFAAGDRRPHLDALEQRMRQAAADLAFERAAAIKQQRERIGGLEHRNYRHVRDIAECRYLVVQRGSTRTRVKPFFVRPEGIEPGEEIPLKQIAQHAPAWIAQLQSAWSPPVPLDSIHRSELHWLLCHFLQKREPPGIFVHQNDPEMQSAEEWAARILDTFQTAKAPASDPRESGSDMGDPNEK